MMSRVLSDIYSPYIITMITATMPMTLLEEIILPTDWGKFRMLAFGDDQQERMPHMAIVHPDLDITQPVTVRIHSECITGDLFHSKRCDCGPQLDYSMRQILKDKGIVLYLRQEGRGIGIINKMKAYNLQDLGIDTHQANQEIKIWSFHRLIVQLCHIQVESDTSLD